MHKLFAFGAFLLDFIYPQPYVRPLKRDIPLDKTVELTLEEIHAINAEIDAWSAVTVDLAVPRY